MNYKRRLIFLSLLTFLQFSLQAQKGRQLKVGDKLSESELASWMKNSGADSKMAGYQGKALIIDFWAPWCSPCIASFPKLIGLQKEFKDQLSLLLVTKEEKGYSKKVLDRFKSDQKSFSSIVEDTSVSARFPHIVLPHYVWLDKNGMVKAITGSEELTSVNVKNFLQESMTLSVPVKQDTLIVTGGGPLFSNGTVSLKDNVIYHSLLTKYIQGLNAASLRGKNWINCTKHSINLLYKIAFGELRLEYINNNRVILEGFETQQDSLLIGYWTEQSKPVWKNMMYDHSYNYELVVPDSNLSIPELFRYMQNDLNRFFYAKGIEGKMEMRKIKILSLIRTSDKDLLKSKGGKEQERYIDNYIELKNKPLYYFISKLQAYVYKVGALPVEDETGYGENVDMAIEADLRDIKAVNAALQKYDLKLVEKEKTIDMIVITKKRPGLTSMK